MAIKASRILIADAQHFHSMKIERLLNAQGYFCIAPVYRLEELLSLVDYADKAFDLLIVNAALATPMSFDLLAFCTNNTQLKHTLIYSEPRAEAWGMPVVVQQNMQVTSLPLPDFEVINTALSIVDSGDEV
ncbi:hypothetical protein PEQA60_37890 [Pseudomonas sp. Eqa60]|uniref:hypothetical protein n=1 Tax=Pseudomonas sp. Eqa60 TaxID=2799184 RepID=UPI001BB31A72|nr:hypothetical protein [Pseudomonas sp. Eqa60]BCQ69799.1 hypothetical protein PEQA60_37890 [Pseudomonas sp. Eqa60]